MKISDSRSAPPAGRSLAGSAPISVGGALNDGSATSAARLLRDELVRGRWATLRRLERAVSHSSVEADRESRKSGCDEPRLRPLKAWPSLRPEHYKAYQSEQEVVRIAHLLGFVQDGDRILDVGCGFGYVAGLLNRERSLSYYCGIDSGAHRISATGEMFQVNALGHCAHHLETRNLFKLTSEFMERHRPDLILLSEVLEHLSDPVAALRAVVEPAPQSACILFSVPLAGRLESCKGHVSFFNADRLQHLCRQAGLTVHDVQPVYDTWAFILASRVADVSTRHLARLTNRQDEPSEPGLDEETFATSTTPQRGAQLFGFEPVSFSRPPNEYRGRWKYRTRSVTVTRAGLRCHVEGSPDSSGGQYGGVHFPARVLRAILLEMTLVNPENVITVFVDGHNGVGARIVRWEWSLTKSPHAGLRPVSCLLEPGQSAVPFKAVGGTIDETVQEIQVFIRIHPNTDAGFVLHRVEAAC